MGHYAVEQYRKLQVEFPDAIKEVNGTGMLYAVTSPAGNPPHSGPFRGEPSGMLYAVTPPPPPLGVGNWMCGIAGDTACHRHGCMLRRSAGLDVRSRKEPRLFASRDTDASLA